MTWMDDRMKRAMERRALESYDAQATPSTAPKPSAKPDTPCRLCRSKAVAHGLCDTHYRAAKRRGLLLDTPRLLTIPSDGQGRPQAA